MNLPSPLQQLLDKIVPKTEQQAFVERALRKALAEKKLEQGDQREPIEFFVDGGSRGNPGPSGGGFAAYIHGKEILRGSEYYGILTNNQAEYLALRDALRALHAQYPERALQCFMDSQLVVEQMNGNYKVKHEKLKPLFEEVRRIADQFPSFQIRHVERAQNKVADRLANEAMDRFKQI